MQSDIGRRNVWRRHLIVIDDAAAADSIMSVKQSVFAINREMPVHVQCLRYRPGPRGIEPNTTTTQDFRMRVEVIFHCKVLVYLLCVHAVTECLTDVKLSAKK
jgi:hypothetical protein